MAWNKAVPPEAATTIETSRQQETEFLARMFTFCFPCSNAFVIDSSPESGLKARWEGEGFVLTQMTWITEISQMRTNLHPT